MHGIVAMIAAAAVGAGAAAAVQGRNGMVASEHRLASAAGIAILREGGNAVDAAVATALALCVVNPASCGIGGGGFMLIFERRSQRVYALDYREAAPSAARRDMFVHAGRAVPELSLHGGLAVATPGEVAGLSEALRRFGTMPFARVAAPAIAYARDGFAIEAHLAEAIARQSVSMRRDPALRAAFLHEDGSPRRASEILRQPDLALTLERIAGGGARAFYEGPIAEAIAAGVRAAGGVLTGADLAAYRPIWRAPLHVRFHGHDVYGMPPPSSGGGVLIEILNILARDDLGALEHNSPTYLHLLAEAMQFGFADRASYYGDPDFTAVPTARLLSTARARAARRRMSAATTFERTYYGSALAPADAGTAHLSVVDGAGNAVACTTSINTSFGSLLVAPGTGIVLNNTMDDFSAQPGSPNVYGLIGSEANSIAPGKRPLSSMTPVIATRGGAVAAVAGGSGGPLIISATLQAVLNTLVFEHDAASALAAPRIHHQWVPGTLFVEPGIPAQAREALRRAGHAIREVAGIAAVQLIRRSDDGELDGAADPRKGGEAAGW